MNHCGLIPRSLLLESYSGSLIMSVIPECFYRWFDWTHHRRDRSWTPD